MSTKKLRTLGRQLVEAKAASTMAAGRLKTLREETQAALLAAYKKHGAIKTAVDIPGVGQVATITLKTGNLEVRVDEDALLKATQEHAPSEIEEVIAADALTDPKVIEAVRKVRPDAVAPKVRDAWRAAKITEATKSRGRILVDKTGEHVKIAEVIEHERTGDFQLTFTGDGKTFVEGLAGSTGRS